MSEKYKFSTPDELHFVTCSVVHWIDLFTRKEFRYIVTDSLKFCQQEKGLVIHAWCLMPSHLHMIISSVGLPLSDFMRDFKKFTSKKVIREMDLINESRKEWLMQSFKRSAEGLKRISKYKVWQDGNHPVTLETKRFIDQKLNYIHDNPVKAEIVEEPEHYLYSSARDYCGMKGLLEVELIE